MQTKIKVNLIKHLLPWIEQFISEVPHIKKITRLAYRKDLLAFVTFLNKNFTWEKGVPLIIKQEPIICWLNDITRRCSLEGTVFQWVGRTNAFLFFLEKRKVLQENPLGLLLRKYPQRGLRGIVRALTGACPKKSLQTLKPTLRFESFLKSYLQGFMSLCRSQGKIYRDEEYTLCGFDRFLKSYPGHPKQLSDLIIRQWLNLFSQCRPSSLYRKITLIRRFCIYVRRFDSGAHVPDSSFIKTPPPFLPYIYSREQLLNLLKASRELKPSLCFPLRPQMFYLVLLLLYTTGMRLGEVLKLRFSDIDWKDKTIFIRQTKFFKSRAVPLSSSMTKELKYHIQLCRQSGFLTTPESLLFQNPYRQNACRHSTIQRWFQEILPEIGLKPTRGHNNPRVHDMRHTMATHRLENWYKENENVQSKLSLLSAYLGHVNIASTQRYLTMTTELLQEASKRFNQYFAKYKESQNESQ